MSVHGLEKMRAHVERERWWEPPPGIDSEAWWHAVAEVCTVVGECLPREAIEDEHYVAARIHQAMLALPFKVGTTFEVERDAECDLIIVRRLPSRVEWRIPAEHVIFTDNWVAYLMVIFLKFPNGTGKILDANDIRDGVFNIKGYLG